MTDFEQLSFTHGPLTFSALAQGSGPVVLCLHGFPDTAQTYRHQLPELAAAGYRAISLSLRGYEPGSIPADGDYTTTAIAEDVLAVIDQLGCERVHLVGHDWGASIAYLAALMAPERFNCLTTMTVPHVGRFMAEIGRHPRQLALSWYMFFFQLRGIADHIVQRNNYAFIRMLWRNWSPGWTPPEEELLAVIANLRQPGVTRAALGYYRCNVSLLSSRFTAKARAQAAFPLAVPTLGLCGERDGCIDPGVFQAMMREQDFPRGLAVEQIANAGHFPHQEQPETVNTLLLEWLSQHDHQT